MFENLTERLQGVFKKLSGQARISENVLKESLRGKGPVYVFGDAGVEMEEIEATTLSTVMAEAADR